MNDHPYQSQHPSYIHAGYHPPESISEQPPPPIERRRKSTPYQSKRRAAAITMAIACLIWLPIGLLANSSSEFFHPRNIVPGITFGCLSLILFIAAQFAPKTEEEATQQKELKLQKHTPYQPKDNAKPEAEASIPLPTIEMNYTKDPETDFTEASLPFAPHNTNALTPPLPPLKRRSILKGLLLVFLLSLLFIMLVILSICIGIHFNNCMVTVIAVGISIGIIVGIGMSLSSPCAKRIPAHKRIHDVSAVDFMEGHAFEHFCASLLKKNGFSNVRVTPPSGDQGVDILATKNDVRYAIQCKNFNTSNLSNKPIQEVYAGKAFYNCHVGVVMTNAHFTPGAVELARATGVLLWDRDVLQQMMDADR